MTNDARVGSQIKNLITEVKDLIGYFKKLEADLHVN